jgi:hypothetical protein
MSLYQDLRLHSLLLIWLLNDGAANNFRMTGSAAICLSYLRIVSYHWIIFGDLERSHALGASGLAPALTVFAPEFPLGVLRSASGVQGFRTRLASSESLRSHGTETCLTACREARGIVYLSRPTI